MTMKAVRPMGVASLLSIFSLLIFLLHLWVTWGTASPSSYSSSDDSSTDHSVKTYLKDGGGQIRGRRPSRKQFDYESEIRNQTLGFEKVFVISLPQRGDRLDAFALSASLTGFTAEVMPGINGSTVPDASLPSTEGAGEEPHLRNARVGTWRAHLNVARTIVQQGLSSALVLEDDSDWDISLKDRMVDFAHGARIIAEHTTKKKSQTPYGDNWDFLWPGHCSIQVQGNDSPGANGPPRGAARGRVLIENDHTTPRAQHRASFSWIPNMSDFPDTTRVVFKADYGICLYAYALSYQGAQKLLRAQAMRKTFIAIDLGIGEMCQDKENPFNCIGIFPQLVDSHRTAGSELKDSNINQELENHIRENAYTLNLLYSSRLNTDNLLKGQKATSQWPDEVDPVPLGSAEGKVKYKVIDCEDGARNNVWPANMPPLPGT